MNALLFDALPLWAMGVSLMAHLSAGTWLGGLYFRSLWPITCRFTRGDHVARTIGMMIGRFILLGGILTLVSMEGAPPLLMVALGILIARPVAMRRVREATS